MSIEMHNRVAKLEKLAEMQEQSLMQLRENCEGLRERVIDLESERMPKEHRGKAHR